MGLKWLIYDGQFTDEFMTAKPSIANNVLELVGNTPLVQLHELPCDQGAAVYAKLEAFNPGGSVKDRIALAMVEAAEESGKLKKNGILIEATTGNTGIGLAMIAAAKNYRLILVVPDDLSVERRRLLSWYGTELVFTSARLGMAECVKVSKELNAKYPGSLLLQQFDNPANPAIHKKTTAVEIWDALEGKLDAFVVGVGTGGTITGCGEYFKEKNSNVQVIAVEPAASAVLSGKPAGFHRLWGIGAGFVPKVLNREIIDEIIPVKDETAFLYANKIARKEGLSIGICSGAVAYAACEVAKRLGPNKKVVTVFPDTWERYVDLEKFFTS